MTVDRANSGSAAAAADRTERSTWCGRSREELQQHQLVRLNRLLAEILPRNRFYRAKLGDARRLSSLAELRSLPLTTKEELVRAQPRGGWSENLTYPLDAYVRFHQTSGTSGFPLQVLDTAEDWEWWLAVWQYVLDSAELTSRDRCLLAFSFGPFVGFWSAFEALIRRGVMAIPSGGLTSLARLELIESTRATVLLCTPSYAQHLSEVAARHGKDLERLGVRAIIVAGEPGGSIPAVRARIEAAWGARLIDHAGASEVGPWGFADSQHSGLHVTETEFIAEFLAADSDQPAAAGAIAELVLTNLGRRGAPIFRYRTGDMVRPVWDHDRPCRFVLLEGGVLGRRDDMLIVRGVNIFPSSIEQIVRETAEIGEFRLTAFREGAMDQLRVEIEAAENLAERVSELLAARLGLRIEVRAAAAGSLPRSEFKSRRLVDLRRSIG